MREISPASSHTAEEYLQLLPEPLRELVAAIRLEKQSGTRRLPSSSLVLGKSVVAESTRKALLDKVATLVDENLAGRSDMCQQYADLLSKALREMGFAEARAALGKASYFSDKGDRLFQWDHIWVRPGDEVIDGNVDSLAENPAVPKSVTVAPYWGPIRATPEDRVLVEDRGAKLALDADVENVWWPDLRDWLSDQGLAKSGRT